MTKIPTAEGLTEIYIVLFVSLSFIIVMALYYAVISPFIKKKNYIKTKIRYSDDEEYLFWKNELKRLYIKHIPFFGKMILKSKK